jgi:hypothetical protein
MEDKRDRSGQSSNSKIKLLLLMPIESGNKKYKIKTLRYSIGHKMNSLLTKKQTDNLNKIITKNDINIIFI